MMQRVWNPPCRWAALALATVPVFALAGCGSSNQFPTASPGVSSTCSALDKFFLNQSAPESELDGVLKKAKASGDQVLEEEARAYQAASALDRSAKTGAFAKMVGRCQYYDIGPNETP